MKRMFPMILLFALLLCVPVRADELTLDAPSALLMEKQTGTVLFAKDEHTPREPASVTKVMTLLLTMEAIDSGALSYDEIKDQVKNMALTEKRQAALRSKINQLKILYPVDKM